METGHLLVVDDEPDMLVNCRRLLNRHGHACTTLSDPTQFTRVFRDCNPDVILCDLRMPGADGMQLLATTRSEDPDLPFVLITAYATVSSAVQAIQEGAFDYLAKPFTAQQLGRCASAALPKKTGSCAIRLRESKASGRSWALARPSVGLSIAFVR